MEAYVARQPIFDIRKKVFAYELLFRDGLLNYVPDIDGDVATSKLLSSSFFTIGLDKITGLKKCVPKKSNVFVRSLTQVYIPYLKVSSQIISQKHKLVLVGNDQETKAIRSDAGKCEICGKALNHNRLLCNSCGKVVHKPKLIFSHSFVCEICKKTICRECASWTRKHLVFKKKVCSMCSKKLIDQGKKIEKFKK